LKQAAFICHYNSLYAALLNGYDKRSQSLVAQDGYLAGHYSNVLIDGELLRRISSLLGKHESIIRQR
jgi:hypothetical protein